jgi:2-dehydro-3-deoxyphosphooctonate aldolase (KDO 8-P synthase)
MNKKITLGTITLSNNFPFVLVAGPCMMQSRDHTMMLAEKIKILTDQHKIPFIFKASFDKANRTSVKGDRGIGLEEGLKVFQEIKKTFNIPVITDVHNEAQCPIVAEVVDILQIPAFLCRQTDLLKAAAETKRIINIKKGQFLSPWEMKNTVSKMEAFGNDQVILCERGTSFGYNLLISDFRGLEVMAETGNPIMFDATHSVQRPGGGGDKTAGDRQFVPLLVRAALSVGVASVFLEVHEDPKKAPSDAANMIPLSYLPYLLPHMVNLDQITKEHLKNTPKMDTIYDETHN